MITSKDKKKFDNPSEIKLGRIYTTLNQHPKKIKSKSKSVKNEKVNVIQNNTYKDKILENILNNNIEQNLLNKDNNSHQPEFDIENLLEKKMKFDSQIKEIKEFLKK